MSKLLHTISQFLMYGLLFLMPLFFIPAGWATIPHAKMSLFALLVTASIVLFLISRFLEGSITVHKSFIGIAALLLPLAYALSGLFSSGDGSFVGLGVERDTVVAITLWVAALLGAAFVFDSRQAIIRGYKLLIVSIGIAGVFHVLSLILGSSIISLGGLISLPPASIVGSWHDLAILLGLSAFLSAALMGSKLVNHNGRLVSGVVLGVSLILLILVNARDVWIILAIFSALAWAYHYLMVKSSGAEIPQEFTAAPVAHDRIKNPTSIALGVVFALALIFSFVGTAVHQVLPESIRIVEIEIRPSWEGTLQVGSQVYEQGFLFGSGPNTFTRQWGLYKPASVNETAFWNTDFTQSVGFIPTSIITAGALGAIAWIIFLAVLVWRGVVSLFMTQMNEHWRTVVLGIFGGLMYMWVFHVVYPPGVALLALTFALTGMFVATQYFAGLVGGTSYSLRFNGTPSMIVGGGAVLIGLVVLVSGVTVGRAIAADIFVNRSIVTFNTTSDIRASQNILETAIALDSGNARARRAAVELGVLELAEQAATGEGTEAEIAELRTTMEETISHALAAVQENSADYEAWITLARVYQELAGVQVEGALESAVGAYQRAAAENPTSPEPHFRLAELALAAGEVEAAKTNLNEAISRKNNYAIAYFLLSQIASSEGNLEEAIAAAERAALSAPQEPLAWFQVGVLHFGAGNIEIARQSLEQAVILNQNYANALYVLGLVYAQEERTDDATVVFQRVLELNPGNESVAQALAALEGLRNPAPSDEDESEEETEGEVTEE